MQKAKISKTRSWLIGCALACSLTGCAFNSPHSLMSEGKFLEAARQFEEDIADQKYVSWRLDKLSEAVVAYDKAGQRSDVLRLVDRAMQSGYYASVLQDARHHEDADERRHRIGVLTDFMDAAMPVLTQQRPEQATALSNDYLSLRSNLGFYWLDGTFKFKGFQSALNAFDKKAAMQLYLMRLGGAEGMQVWSYPSAREYAQQNGFTLLEKRLQAQQEAVAQLEQLNAKRQRPEYDDHALMTIQARQDAQQLVKMKQPVLACYQEAKARYHLQQQQKKLVQLKARLEAQQQQQETLDTFKGVMEGLVALNNARSGASVPSTPQSSSAQMNQLLQQYNLKYQEQERLKAQQQVATQLERELAKSMALQAVADGQDALGGCQALR